MFISTSHFEYAVVLFVSQEWDDGVTVASKSTDCDN